MRSKRRFIKFVILSALLYLITPCYADNSRIHYNNQDLFLNGANLAWQSFANDIGPSTSTPDLAHFEDVFSQFEANGGNVMRLWLHTNGANTPQWSGNTVTGPGTNTISDLQAILDLAWEHKVSVMCCLWSFDMLRTSYGTTITDRSYAILTDPTYRQSYIDNSLIPMVSALAGHPAIVAWEIFNEPEGMSNEHGWDFTRHVPMANIQAFVNKCAGAIHRTDPTVMVTNGCWDMQAGTDVDGHTNYYTDARLIAAGGDADGTLDFYCIHYYDWAGTEHAPFLHPASYWGLDKPLVIAEFYPDCAATYCTSTPYESLYQNGYAGAIGWSWTDVSPSLLLAQMNAIWTAHPTDVEIIPSTDTEPPVAPTGLSATGGEQTVSLNWNDNTEEDLRGYNVYRSTTTGGPYSKINGAFLATSNYTDNSVNGYVTYYYVVTALDTSNNESDTSSEVYATPTDTTSPAAPTGLAALAGDQTVSLDWSNNSEPDIDGYNIYRSTVSGSGYAKINGSLLSSSAYVDNSVINGKTYYYVVTAVDTSSNESGYSGQVSAQPHIITDVEILGSWVTGTSHAKEAGTNRALVFLVHAEYANTGVSLNSVTYGGRPMSKVIDRYLAGSTNRVYMAAFILSDANIALADSSGTFSPNWTGTPTGIAYSSVFLKNVDQTAPVSASASGSGTSNPTTTTVLATSNGDMVILAAGASTTGTFTLNNSFVEVNEYTMTSSDGVDGNKLATGVPETPSVTHSSGTARKVVIGFVAKAMAYVVQGDGSGSVLSEWWTGIPGTAISDLTSDVNYPANPAGRELLTSLEGPTNWGDDYGNRIRGYLYPPSDGDYTFSLTSDADSQLWLSTDDTPANKALIASVSGSGSQQSSLISLLTGQKYYIEVLHKEGTGDDNISVSWEGPGITQEVIDGIYLSPAALQFEDYSGFAGQWHQTGCNAGNEWCYGFDFTRDGNVQLDDLDKFAESWLFGN